MNRPVLTSFAIILLIGYSWAENVLDPGPVYSSTGDEVQFNTIFIPPLQGFRSISWASGAINVITWISPNNENVGLEYKGRVILNKTTGGLTIRKLKLTDSGVYTLTLVPADGSQSLHGRTVLEVFDPVTNVTITGPNITLIEGKTSAKFSCDGNGSITTTEWMKDGQRLSESDRIIFSADNRSVSIDPVSRSDSGEYICNLSNPVISDQANYSITVLYGPDVKILGAEILDEGSDILLYCLVSSAPTASLIWTVNDMNAGISALYMQENSRLSHSGIYTCSASNHITGEIRSAEHTLTVRGTSVLTPGEIAGIVVGVILVVLLAVSMFFNFRNFKGFRGNAQIQNEVNIKNQDRPIPKKTQVEENPMKQTAFKDTNPYQNPDEIYEVFVGGMELRPAAESDEPASPSHQRDISLHNRRLQFQDGVSGPQF
ncbi:cell adhesion molecule CEACAM6-like [Misgurnus anguillicaudatus]|uniref:cell adhesion molecule CEACAM6-like n=1 Tax=Misgurnus anguillicaudatus TaxID=75329 RepID=UPI003CCFC35F